MFVCLVFWIGKWVSEDMGRFIESGFVDFDVVGIAFIGFMECSCDHIYYYLCFWPL